VSPGGGPAGEALTEALAALDPLVADAEYLLLGYERGTAPPSPDAVAAESFAVRIDDPFETTFVLRVALAETLPEPAVRIGPLRAIVLTSALPPDLTGFISTIAGALAERGISLVPIGAATRDAVLVPTAAWPEALAILRGLRDAARTVLGARDDPST
jgi:hypothetical protein